MMNKSIVMRFLSLGLAVAGFVLIGGNSTHIQAQSDPFAKPGWAKRFRDMMAAKKAAQS